MQLQLADGTIIDTATGRPVRQNGALPGYEEVPSNTEAVREIQAVRRRVDDLPDIPQRMNIIAAVASYYMFGLDEYETAHALGCTQQQVVNIKMTEAFGRLIEVMTQSVVDTQQDNIRTIITNNSRKAVATLVDAMDDEDMKVAVVAAKDILDRGGHRPADVVEHRHKVEGGLVIEYVKRGGKDDTPALELDATQFKEVEDDGNSS